MLRNAFRSKIPRKPNLPLPFSIPLAAPKHFSARAFQPPDNSSSPPVHPFLQDTGDGMVYGRLVGYGISKHTLRTDIVNFLEGSNLTPDDIRPIYTNLIPTSMMIQFSSRQAYENAIRVIGKKGRLYKLDMIDRSNWDRNMPYYGKSVVLEGIPNDAIAEDVENFLSGCKFDSSSIQLPPRRERGPQNLRMALVRFLTRVDAMNAYITKNRGFCRNSQISIRVLQ